MFSEKTPAYEAIFIAGFVVNILQGDLEIPFSF